MISRVAEGAFWMARYLERADTLARLLYVNNNFVLDVDLENTPRWQPLVVVAGEEERFSKVIPKGSEDDGEAVQAFLTWNQDNPSAILSSIESARENARGIREIISLEMWETINSLWLWMRSETARKLYQKERYEFYLHVRNSCSLFNGFALDTMLQSEAYHFMRLGASLERAGQTVRVVDVKYHAMGPTGQSVEYPMEVAQWQAILRSCSAIEPYFKVANGEMNGVRIAQFLLFDRHFSRSVLRSLDRSWNFLQLIRSNGKSTIGKNSANLLKQLRSDLSKLHMTEVVKKGLHPTLTRIVSAVGEVCMAVQQDYFFAVPLEVRRSRATTTRKPGKRA
ncbi:MAG: alpha-E domain-containing protein [Deltaproteobacteria bacterium]|nr:alpha-E domain-containing protein [Deltaproteobacteria bacterium]